MLAVAVCVSVGLASTSQRNERLGALAVAALQAVALALTQSKGGWLAAATGLVAFVACTLAWRTPRAALFALVPIVAGGLFSLALTAAPTARAAPGAFARIADAGSTGEQSAGYRILLWKSALELAKDRPQGTGVGTFQYESARPGLVQRTFHAHQTWLQVAAESGWAAFLALVALAVVWCREVGRGALSQPPERNALRAGAAGAVVAGAAAGFTESTLIFAGLGIVQFALMGVALQLSADGTEPQLTPHRIRRTLAALALLPLIPLALGAIVEGRKAASLAAMATGDLSNARDLAASAAGPSLGLDGEAHYLAALAQPDPAVRVESLRTAAKTLPTPRVLRALARAEQEAGRSLAARTALEAALARDPNNLPALDALRRSLAGDGLESDAVAAAQRALAVEATPAYQVRAIPESVPLETFDARVFLADRATDPAEQTRLLREAVEGYLQYRRLTVPQIERFARADLTFLGESMDDAREAMGRARAAAQRLRALYSSAGDSEGVAWAESAVAELVLD
jgi:tetratricopeptide (TPR) repeat protein